MQGEAILDRGTIQVWDAVEVCHGGTWFRGTVTDRRGSLIVVKYALSKVSECMTICRQVRKVTDWVGVD